MIALKKQNIVGAMRTVCVCSLIGLASVANAAEPSVSVRHLVSEQNILTIKDAKKYLLLPVQDNAPEGKIYVVVNNQREGSVINIRLAREKVDYYVPLDLSAYEGKNLSIDVQGVPEASVCWKRIRLSDTFDTANREKFRPVYHHTPVYGWMNDPNGMFYKDGVYHLYFQHNPYGSTWGNLSWGHSTSTDLVNWKFEGDAITPDAWGMIFSGSSVVDYENTAGFGEGAVVAFYTSAKPSPWGDVQTQSMAYSLDNGETFIKYEGNPIVISDKRDFRDPKVFWYAPGKHWVMILAGGQEMDIYTSKNLKEWKYESSFGAKQGAHGGVWECPDLVELPVEGTDEKKWVLICNINPGGPFGGSAAQYFVGDFDGKTFTCDTKPEVTKWMDYGKDHYAAVSWSNTPEKRHTVIAWMSNWQYANNVPTKQFRSANTLPRDIELYEGSDGELYLAATPALEVNALRTGKALKYGAFSAGTKKVSRKLPVENSGICEINLELAPRSADKVYITLSNDKDEQTVMTYDLRNSTFSMDRTASGLTDFNKDFPAITVAPCPAEAKQRLRLFIDRCSIEAFEGDGRFAMTNLVFPQHPYTTISIAVDKGRCKVNNLTVNTLKVNN